MSRRRGNILRRAEPLQFRENTTGKERFLEQMFDAKRRPVIASTLGTVHGYVLPVTLIMTCVNIFEC